MKHHSVSEPEPAWPRPDEKQVLQVLEQSCREVCAPVKQQAGRPCLVSWPHLCLAIVLCFLRGWHTQLQLWRVIRCEQLGDFAPVPVSDQAIYNRIQRAESAMLGIFEQVSGWLRNRLAPWQDHRLAPWASAVYAVDTSTLDRLGRFLPWLRALAPGDLSLLGGQISALLDVRLQQWRRVQHWPEARDNCKEHLLALLESLPTGVLLLFDRGYLSIPIFDTLTQRGLWWISRYANEVSYQVSHICYQADGVLDAVVTLGSRRSNQATSPVRLIQFWWQGRHYRYLTNVLDPHVLPLSEVVKLYARRWDIELGFRALKDHLNLHHLWSAKPTVLRVQLWCTLILAQIYHALQVEIARQAGVEVFDVSLDLLVRLTPGWLARGVAPLAYAVRFGRELGLIRPSTRHRIEVPWIDPTWVVPPPAQAVQPRPEARYRPSKPRGTRTTPRQFGRVRLIQGKLHLLE